jgi:hypothetical protein
MNRHSIRLVVSTCLLVLAASSWSLAAGVTIAGSVVANDSTALAQVTVTVYRGRNAVGTTQTSATGAYDVAIAPGGLVDYILFERAHYLPRIIEGPLSTAADNRINVVMLPASTKTPSRPALLSTLHSLHFMQVILGRTDTPPKTLAIPDDLALSMRCTQVVSSTGGSSGGGPEHMKSVDKWPRDDTFFPADDASPSTAHPQQRPKP